MKFLLKCMYLLVPLYTLLIFIFPFMLLFNSCIKRNLRNKQFQKLGHRYYTKDVGYIYQGLESLSNILAGFFIFIGWFSISEQVIEVLACHCWVALCTLSTSCPLYFCYIIW